MAKVNESTCGPEPGGAPQSRIGMPGGQPFGSFQIMASHQKIRDVFDGRVGEVLRALSIATFPVVVLAQMHAHRQYRPCSPRSVGFQDEMGEVLSDLVRTDNAFSRPASLYQTRTPRREHRSAASHWRARTSRYPGRLCWAARSLLVFLYVALLVPYQICAQAVTGDHKILSDKSSERGLI